MTSRGGKHEPGFLGIIENIVGKGEILECWLTLYSIDTHFDTSTTDSF